MAIFEVTRAVIDLLDLAFEPTPTLCACTDVEGRRFGSCQRVCVVDKDHLQSRLLSPRSPIYPPVVFKVYPDLPNS